MGRTEVPANQFPSSSKTKAGSGCLTAWALLERVQSWPVLCQLRGPSQTEPAESEQPRVRRRGLGYPAELGFRAVAAQADLVRPAWRREAALAAHRTGPHAARRTE